MPTERLASLVFALAIAAVVLVGAPVAIPQGLDKAVHFAAFSALTLCLWRATGGSMPVLVVVGVALLGALHEYRQAYLPDRVSGATGFLADLAAAIATAALVLMQRKPTCAESSQP